MTSRSPDRQLAYEVIVERVKKQLLAGELKPGDRLPTIAEGAKDQGLSPGSVREAYRVLENRGLLEIVQGRGTFVAEDIGSRIDVLQSLHFAGGPTRAHLLEARRLLEPQVAAMAAHRASKAERDAIVQASEEDERRPLEVRQWVQHNMTFHGLIALASHNPVVTQMLTSIYEYFEKSEPHPAENPVVREKGRHFHRLIALAIAEGDGDAAQVLMEQHIASVESILGRAEPAHAHEPSVPAPLQEA